MKTAFNNVLRSTENAEVNSTTSATAAPIKRILVHTRNEDDRKILSENFDLSKLGKPSYVSGLMGEARMALVKAAAAGIQIVSTGVPVDLLAEIGGEVTLLRAWSKTKEDGTRSSGSVPPCNYFASKIRNQAAYDALKATPEFQLAFHPPEEDENAEGQDIAGF